LREELFKATTEGRTARAAGEDDGGAREDEEGREGEGRAAERAAFLGAGAAADGAALEGRGIGGGFEDNDAFFERLREGLGEGSASSVAAFFAGRLRCCSFFRSCFCVTEDSFLGLFFPSASFAGRCWRLGV